MRCPRDSLIRRPGVGEPVHRQDLEHLTSLIMNKKKSVRADGRVFASLCSTTNNRRGDRRLVLFHTALGHFAKPDEMLQMLPPWVPLRKVVVLLSGGLELAFAVGVSILAISHPTAITAIVFLFLAAPLNLYSAYHRVNFGGHAGGPAYLLVRLQLHFF